MTLFTPEQFVAIQKANFDVAFALSKALTDSFEKLTTLNLQLSKETLARTQAAILQTVAAQTPSEGGAPRAFGPSLPEQAQSYSRELANLASATAAELMRVGEGQNEAYNRRLEALIDDLSKNGPSGSEAAIAAWKSAVTTTNTLFETIRKSYEQAVHATESSLAVISGASK